MAERVAEKTILVDGPMAGHLYRIPEGIRSWGARCVQDRLFVRVPRPLKLPTMTDPAAGPIPSLADDTAVYRIFLVIYQHGPDRHHVRVGLTGGFHPEERDLLEHVPTGLAEQGAIPWDDVVSTTRDRREPIRVETVGDPLKACEIDTGGAVYWSDQIDASCACGWRTERVSLDRRSQLQRAAHRHALGEAARRERFHEPIRIAFPGAGMQADCYGGLAVDERAERVYGVCRRCGWETERVEYFRTAPLRDLCKAHRGPDGVRRVRDQLLAALLPGYDQSWSFDD